MAKHVIVSVLYGFHSMIIPSISNIHRWNHRFIDANDKSTVIFFPKFSVDIQHGQLIFSILKGCQA